MPDIHVAKLGTAIAEAVRCADAGADCKEAIAAAARAASEAAIAAANAGRTELARRILLVESRLRAAGRAAPSSVAELLSEAHKAWHGLIDR